MRNYKKTLSDTVKRIDEFFQNNQWKNFKKVKSWPIKNDIIYVKKYNKFKYETEYNRITYFEYKSTVAKPPIEPKENHKWCKHCRGEKHNDEFKNGINICKPCAKKYRRENFAELEAQKMKEKYRSNEVHRIGCVVKAHLSHILKGRFNKLKDKSWEEIVGLSKQDFFNYIISQCKPEWTMDNYGVDWVLQHIIPRDWAEVPEDAYLLNYYKNLMPWGFSDNSALGNRLEPSQLNKWHSNNQRIKYLINKNN